MEPMTNPEAQTASGGARLRKGSAKTPLIVLGVIVAVLAAGYLGLCAFALHHSTIWQETFVLGVNVGGMSEEEATQAVSDALSEMQISLYLYPDGGEMPDTAVQTPDAQIPLSDLDAQIDVPALVQGADAAQRAGSFFTAGWRYQATACPTPEIRKTFRWTPPRLPQRPRTLPPRFPGRRRTPAIP